MKKVWYKKGVLRMRVGEITDTFGQYVEVKDDETGDFIIVPFSDVQVIVKTEQNYVEL
jgi:hypothetical protein